MARTTQWDSLSSQIRDALRTDILSAVWSPGTKLQVAQLSKRYETSTTVVREALTRLAGEQLVTLIPNRGFFVAELTLDELDSTLVEVVTDGQGYSATQVEYQVTRWLSLLSTVSTIGRSSASVRVSKDY